MKKTSTGRPYTEEYKKQCKVIWYKIGRTDSLTALQEQLPEDEFGRKPQLSLLSVWRDVEGWDIWADALDVRVELEIDDELVAARIMMLKEQASRALEMQRKGINYLRKHDFDTSSSAVNAIIQGAKMERTSRGISERMEKLLTMDDEGLTKEAMKLLGQAKDAGEILDMEAEDIEEEENDEEADS